MKITKIGHSCLVIEENGVRILTDPGSYTTTQNRLTNIDAVLITHDHQDHCDINSIKIILVNNPGVEIITNPEVQAKLTAEGIAASLLEDAQTKKIKGVTIQGFGKKHAVVYPELPIAVNVGYLIAGRLFHPGDSYTVPTTPVEILAVPAGGPWHKLSESIDYAKLVKPKTAFPIHNAMFKDPKSTGHWQERFLTDAGINYIFIPDGESAEF